MTPAGQFGDTTYTKIFVGGLAWETQKDTMTTYFQQFGEIMEAVVITDKATGRSKGYGFVTFRDADAAVRACVDANPVIDGRRANCNLASLGVQKSKTSSTLNTKNHNNNGKFGGIRNTRVMGGFHHHIQAAAVFNQAAGNSFSHYSVQQGIPSYNFLYGYAPFSAEYAYPASYYGVYGGANGGQYPLYGSGTGGMVSGAAAAYYPYNLNFSEGCEGITGYTSNQGHGSIQFPQHLFQYPAISSAAALYPHHYGTPLSIAPPSPLQSGVTMALHR
ncbi:uncharacterized protein [Primulina eburnea]|uniref:uncharacterized protein isoform X1 n=1 Tax=Primulina eburnea TaxID=1245227 RepID=UPI003C6C6F34